MVPDELSLDTARKLKNVTEFKQTANVKFPKTKRGQKLSRKTAVNLRTVRKETARAENFEDLLKENPLASYTDRAPSITSDMEFALNMFGIKAFITPESMAKKFGPMARVVMESKFQPLGVRLTQVKDIVKLTGGKHKGRFNKAVGITPKIERKLARVPEHRRETDVYMRVYSTLERHGFDREKSIAVIMSRKDIVNQTTKKQLTRQQAEEAYDSMNDFRKQINEGVKSEIALPTHGGRELYEVEGYDRLVELDPDEYRKLGGRAIARMHAGGDPNTAMYMPHTLRSFKSNADMQSAVKASMPPEQWEKLRLRLNQRRQRNSRPFINSLDFQRSMPGTMEEKILAGVPLIRDPFDSMQRYMFGVNQAYETGRHFGFTIKQQEEVMEAIYRVVRQENKFVPKATKLMAAEARRVGVVPAGEEAIPNEGAGKIFQAMADVALGNQWESEAERKLASFLTSYNIITKLTMAVLANMSQTTQTTTFNGVRNTFKSFHSLTKKEKKRSIEWGISATEGVLFDPHTYTFQERSFRSGGLGSVLANAFQDMSDYTLKGTQFSRVEGWNRKIGGGAAMHRALEMTLKGAGMGKHGVRLKGKQLDYARRQARSMGFDLDDVVNKMRKGGFKDVDGHEVYAWYNTDEGMRWFQNTLFRGAQQTQFMVTPMRRPLWWGTPGGRVVFQFKTFAMQQYRFLRDQVLQEVARGNPKPLAIYLGVAPVAGELVGNMKELVRDGRLDRGDNGFARYLQKMIYVGGAGVIGDMWQAAQYEQFLEGALGPTASDLASWVEQSARLDGAGFARDLGRQPLGRSVRALTKYVLPTVGGITSEWTDNMMELSGFNEGSTGKTFSTPISPGELMQRKRKGN